MNYSELTTTNVDNYAPFVQYTPINSLSNNVNELNSSTPNNVENVLSNDNLNNSLTEIASLNNNSVENNAVENNAVANNVVANNVVVNNAVENNAVANVMVDEEKEEFQNSNQNNLGSLLCLGFLLMLVFRKE